MLKNNDPTLIKTIHLYHQHYFFLDLKYLNFLSKLVKDTSWNAPNIKKFIVKF